MKNKLLILLLCALMLLSACQASDNEQNENNSQIALNSFDGITLQAKEVVADGDDIKLVVSWKNETEFEVLYGEMFRVERYVDGKWKVCDAGESNAFFSIANLLAPKSAHTKTYGVSNYYKVSEAGKYRLLTEYSVVLSVDVTKRCTVSAEFELTESGYTVPDDQQSDINAKPFDGKSPPKLDMLLNNVYLEGMQFGYSWNYPTDDGELWECVITDTLHPLQVQDFTLQSTVSRQSAVLVFNAEPESIEVSYWSDENIGNTSAPETKLDYEKISSDKYVLELINGSNIYYVKATFKEEKYYGSVDYCFYLKVE